MALVHGEADMIKIALLADFPEVIPTLAQWFRRQWPNYYAARTLSDITQDFYAEANRRGLPVRFVAFADNNVAGTVILREQVIVDQAEFTPGLGGLFVVEAYRSRGIGTKLIKAGMELAREQGYESLYATTATASSILERLGWRLVKMLQHDDEHLGLYVCRVSMRRG
jgi:GNAT superfamily N-acetyltransferase